ncbi:signal peptidase I [Candidatus Uhrbacteria bacterium]|nr:signal peptidase I [Candidatus Uhrbacteria bacterium]
MEEEQRPGGEKIPAAAGRSIIRAALEYIGELIRVVVISLAIILPIRYFLVQPFYVKGASMEPNFYDHEYLIIDELSYRLREPRRGEIVVFRYPADPAQFFIKRIVGLPGETVEIQNSALKIKNAQYPEGVVFTEDYLDSGAVIYGNFSVALGNGEYYLLGDNRSSSLDSRQFGPVAKQLLIGRAWIRGWPLDKVTRFIAPLYVEKEN